jgi:hypothetical protein
MTLRKFGDIVSKLTLQETLGVGTIEGQDREFIEGTNVSYCASGLAKRACPFEYRMHDKCLALKTLTVLIITTKQTL